MTEQIILASTSIYRKKLMEQLALDFETIAPNFDESKVKRGSLPPAEYALGLAEGKAKSLLGKYPDAIIIGSDQVSVIEDEILGKPGDKQKAVEQLERLNGKTHELLTAMVVLHKDLAYRHIDQTLLTMRQLDQDQLIRYVDRDNPVNSAGSYKIEANGICLFKRIQSDDHSAIVGLPLLKLVDVLTQVGLKLP